jgi:hypothetical protein
MYIKMLGFVHPAFKFTNYMETVKTLTIDNNKIIFCSKFLAYYYYYYYYYWTDLYNNIP